MRWPWSRETRAADGYTSRIIEASYDRATLPGDFPRATAALETAAGLWARAFASATVEDAPPAVAAALTPDVLALIARNLVRRGEAIHAIEVMGGEIRLVPVGDFDVQSGGWDESTWSYRITKSGPSRQTTTSVPSMGVIHCRYAVSASAPWRGVDPLAVGQLIRRPCWRLSRANLRDEHRLGPNQIIPMPVSATAETPRERRNLTRISCIRTAQSDHGGNPVRARPHAGQTWGSDTSTPERTAGYNAAAHRSRAATDQFAHSYRNRDGRAVGVRHTTRPDGRKRRAAAGSREGLGGSYCTVPSRRWPGGAASGTAAQARRAKPSTRLP